MVLRDFLLKSKKQKNGSFAISSNGM